MASTTSKTTQTVDLTSLSPEQLQELIVNANKIRAEQEVRELAERRQAALEATRKALAEIPTVDAATKHAEAGEISQLIMELNKIITAATEARKAATTAGRETGVKVAKSNGGTGTQRDSDLRNEILEVVNSAPSVTWTSSSIQKEVSNSPTTNNPRSTGLLGNHLESLAEHGQIRRVSDSPKKYQANEQSAE